MFGLLERARLAMHEKTLANAVQAAPGQEAEYAVAMAGAVAYLCEYTRQLPTPNLWTVIARVEPSRVSIADTSMMRIADTFRREIGSESGYQAATIISGLLMSRVVEIKRPGLAERALRYRHVALGFAQPLYATGMALPADVRS